jgi:hypothetical protein
LFEDGEFVAIKIKPWNFFVKGLRLHVVHFSRQFLFPLPRFFFTPLARKKFRKIFSEFFLCKFYTRKKLQNVFFEIFSTLEGWKRNLAGGKRNFHFFSNYIFVFFLGHLKKGVLILLLPKIESLLYVPYVWFWQFLFQPRVFFFISLARKKIWKTFSNLF